MRRFPRVFGFTIGAILGIGLLLLALAVPQIAYAHHDDLHLSTTCATFSFDADFYGGGETGTARQAKVYQNGVLVQTTNFTGKVDVADFFTLSGELPANITIRIYLYSKDSNGQFTIQVDYDTKTVNSVYSCTSTPTHTPTWTWTPSPTWTWTPSNTPTNTPTNTLTPSNTPTWTFTPSDTATWTNTPSWTPSWTWTPSPTNTLVPSDTPTSTQTATATDTRTPDPTATLTATQESTQPPEHKIVQCKREREYFPSLVNGWWYKLFNPPNIEVKDNWVFFYLGNENNWDGVYEIFDGSHVSTGEFVRITPTIWENGLAVEYSCEPVENPEPTPAPQPCPICGDRICALRKGYFAINGPNILGISTDGTPKYYSNWEAAAADGLRYAGIECGFCGDDLIRLSATGEIEVFFGPGFNSAEVSWALAKYLDHRSPYHNNDIWPNDQDLQIGDAASEYFHSHNSPAEGIWFPTGITN